MTLQYKCTMLYFSIDMHYCNELNVSKCYILVLTRVIFRVAGKDCKNCDGWKRHKNAGV